MNTDPPPSITSGDKAPTLAGLYSDEPALAQRAAELAVRIGTRLLATKPTAALALRLDDDGLALIDTRPGAPGPLQADFRPLLRRSGSLRNEAIARAVGLRGNRQLQIIDATAGLGRDAFVLASLGAQVHLIERSPIIYALLHDGHARALQDPALADTAARMTLQQGDALGLLPDISEQLQTDVIYLDPMYPEASTKGQVKKDMQFLRALLGPASSAEPLLQVALTSHCQRVAVKRPNRAAALSTTLVPNHTIQGRHTRFEVYLGPRA